jgi:hypothetical protein
MRGATEAYLAENHPTFLNKFNDSRWTAYFNANIDKDVSSYDKLS